jgi:pimeloyl-ACP methyl ester carboxylesterase
MWQEDDYGPAQTTHPDWDDCHIGNKGSPGEGACERDLEDFTRLHIKLDPMLATIPGVTYWLRFEDASGGPLVNIFEAVDATAEYLSVPSKAASQVQKDRLMQVFGGGADYPLNPSKIHTDGSASCFLLEGGHAGTGALTFVVKKDGSEICKQSVTLQLHDIAWFYNVWQAQVLSGERWTVEVTATANHAQAAGYAPETDEKFLFVHGWNMEGWEKRRWTETIFKRLWWQGYKGSVALFDWPTMDGYAPDIWPPSSLADALFGLRHFDNSEYRSWRSSDALAGLLSALNSGENLHVLAHSMGNVVTAEALRKYSGPKVKTYIAAQAALSAQFYDGGVASRDPSLHLNGADTPDIMGHFDSGGTDTAAYLAGVLENRVSAGRVFNYHNHEDYALGIWEHNNNYKPDNWTPYLFSYAGSMENYQEGIDHFFRGQVNNMYEVLSVANEVQRHRIFAYIAESRSLALGQATGGVSGFAGWDLKANMDYNSHHYSHSREFRSNVAAEFDFWRAVKIDCGFANQQQP